MAERLLNIVFPTGGLDLRPAYQWQRPFKLADVCNCVPSDPLLARDRGGVRPGLTKYHASNWDGAGRCACIYTDWDGTRFIVVGTSAGIAYSGIDGDTAGGGTGLGPNGRLQCVPFGNRIYFVGDTANNYPKYAEFSSGTIAVIADFQPDFDPSFPFPLSPPLVIAVKYDRLFLAYGGDASMENGLPCRFWASAVGDELDFENDRDAADPTTAYSAEINTTRDRITAMIPWFGDYMVFATATTLYVLDGDPRAGGTMRQVSTRIGIIDAASWAVCANNEIIALSASGPIKLSPSAPLQEPQLVMRDALPGVLISPDTANYDHVVGYDARSRRVCIFRSKHTAAADIDHYMLDLQENGWWKYRFAETDHEPFAVLTVHEITPQQTDMLMFCRDGYARVFDQAAATDDGTDIDSFAMLGPFRANDPHVTGIINELTVSLAVDSGEVTISIHPGNSAEEAYRAAAKWSRTFTAGRSPTRMPRINCDTFYMKISGTAGARWAFESAAAGILAGGKLRT